jgi:hypothetical protein
MFVNEFRTGFSLRFGHKKQSQGKISPSKLPEAEDGVLDFSACPRHNQWILANWTLANH